MDADPHYSGWDILAVLVPIALLVAFVWGISRMHGDGDGKSAHLGGSGAGPAMLELQKILQPAAEHVIEAQQDQRTADAEAGDPPNRDGDPTRSS